MTIRLLISQKNVQFVSDIKLKRVIEAETLKEM